MYAVVKVESGKITYKYYTSNKKEAEEIYNLVKEIEEQDAIRNDIEYQIDLLQGDIEYWADEIEKELNNNDNIEDLKAWIKEYLGEMRQSIEKLANIEPTEVIWKEVEDVEDIQDFLGDELGQKFEIITVETWWYKDAEEPSETWVVLAKVISS